MSRIASDTTVRRGFPGRLTTKVQSARRGISLLEVIACTVLVTFLMVPIAGVIRASGQAMARAQSDGTPEAQARRTLRWLRLKLDGDLDTPPVISSNGRRLRLQRNGQRIVVAIQRGQLIWNNTSTGDQIVLAENARSFQVVPRTSAGVFLGMDVTLGLRNVANGTTASTTTTVALQ